MQWLLREGKYSLSFNEMTETALRTIDLYIIYSSILWNKTYTIAFDGRT